MTELELDKYWLLDKPLKDVEINNLFARSVIEKKVSGKIYVDNNKNPKTFYVVHPYGMSLLFGESNNGEFNNRLTDYCLNRNRQREKHEWMQAFPNNWDTVLPELFGEKLVGSSGLDEAPQDYIEQNTRANFKFDLEKYLDFKKKNIKEKYKIVRTDKDIFKDMNGSVVPSNFWDSAEDFCKNGVGFSLFYENKLATTAYSAFIFDEELELGMETVPEFRGRGFAQYACSVLIDYCLQNNYEPIWACKLTNAPSYKLALKLGFVLNLKLPYYRLAV